MALGVTCSRCTVVFSANSMATSCRFCWYKLISRYTGNHQFQLQISLIYNDRRCTMSTVFESNLNSVPDLTTFYIFRIMNGSKVMLRLQLVVPRFLIVSSTVSSYFSSFFKYGFENLSPLSILLT